MSWILWGLVVLTAGSAISFWGSPAHATLRTSLLGGVFVVSFTILMLFLAWQIVRAARERTTSLPFVVSAFLLLLASYLLQLSLFYYRLGNPPNWNIPLTKDDAIYVTVGTLTTGASGISPVSEAAHNALIIQQVVDLLILSVVIAFVVDRFRHRAESDSSHPPEEQLPDEPFDYGF